MSKSAMLRTRRRDVNVKPNRRLDRKSSRGMIYENEELRLRTININAEIERGQSDIKKLRRENEQLRKEIWCLRDEYEKLDKLLKEKGDTSCSSCSSDTDSCTSCTESEENETTQNIENVQKTTTLNNLRTEFDHLSVVTEETSAENSDKNSNSATSPKECAWDVIPPDQSYPNSQTLPLPTSKSALPMEQMPKHFFAPLKPSKSYENCHENNLCASSWSLGGNTYGNNPANWMQFVNFDQNLNKQPPIVMQKPALPACHQVIAQKTVLPPSPVPVFEPNLPPPPMFEQNLLANTVSDLPLCKKTTPDIVVKTDLPNFSQDSSTNSFVNGGNLDELLQDIQTISNDILQISSQQDASQKLTNTFVPNVTVEQFEPVLEDGKDLDESKFNSSERPYKSELNVVLMPKAMPLLGFDKYQNIKSSLESLATLKKSVESLPMLDIPAAEMNLANVPSAQSFTPQPFPTELLSFTPTPKPETPIPPIPPAAKLHPELNRQTSNPFFYGTFDNYQNTDAFTNRYNPDIFAHDNYGFKNEVLQQSSNKPEEKDDKTNIKTNIENEIVENKVGNKPEKEAKQEKSENERNDSKKELNKKEDAQQKSPKSRRTRKVSIYFKGKKDKLARSLSLDTKMIHQDTPKPAEKSPIIDDRKSSLANPKTSSSESKMSLFDGILPKHQDTTEKLINSDTNKTSSDSKNSNYDRKHRKSSSTSPERKHVHVKLENEKKCHKKRHKKSERRLPANRRASMSADRVRERSFSVCTDRSNILDHKFGHFEDYTNSERDRSNSLSSCDTVKSRKMSVPQFPVAGKIPWFGCWGNGCL